MKLADKILSPLAWVVIAALALSMTAGCSLSPSPPTPTAAPTLDFSGLGPVPFDHYMARFTLEFSGDPAWRYQLTTRRAAEIVERHLAIDGVEDTRNPGEVRMVTQDGVTRMRGEGTEDRCLRFPESMGVNVTLLAPDDILPPEDFREDFVLLGGEQVGGFDTNHYAMQQSELDGWQQVQIGIWQAAAGSAVIQYELEALGWDPYFGAGWGELTGRYELLEVGQQTIKPIEGCQVDLPLPEEVRELVVLPEVIAFGSPQPVDELAAFYRESLEGDGWRALDQEERSSGAVVLSYLRDGERLRITIRRFNENSQVELLRE